MNNYEALFFNSERCFSVYFDENEGEPGGVMLGGEPGGVLEISGHRPWIYEQNWHPSAWLRVPRGVCGASVARICPFNPVLGVF